jgi:tight adherence protein B
MPVMDDLLIVIALVFLAATLGIYGVYWVFALNRREQKVINRRLELSKGIASQSEVLNALRQERGFSNLNSPILQRLSDWLTQTGLSVQRKTLGLAFLFLFLILALALSTYLGFGLASLALALIAAAAIMFLFLNFRRRRRILEFSEQLPDAVDIITRGVRVGLPFPSAVALVAREMPDPVGTEFGMLADEISFGQDLSSALDNLYRRVGQDDLLFLTVAVTIQTQTGGNLGEILSRLSKLMRSRATMRLKVNSLSAEGRLSAIVLSALPFGLFFIVNYISPKYYGDIRGNGLVEPLVYLALFMLAVGNVIMYRMVHFKY